LGPGQREAIGWNMSESSNTNHIESAEKGSGQPYLSNESESLNIGRIQLLLAEKRTSLSALRTGIAVFTLPLSVTTVLVTTSRYYDFFQNLYYLIPLLLLCAVLVAVGSILIINSLMKFHRQGNQIQRIKDTSPKWKELID